MRYKILLLMWLPALFSLRAATVPAVIAVSALLCSKRILFLA